MYWYLLFLCHVVLCRLLVRRARKMAQDYYMLYHEPIPTAQEGHLPLCITPYLGLIRSQISSKHYRTLFSPKFFYIDEQFFLTLFFQH
jgi:hypothetical protein